MTRLNRISKREIISLIQFGHNDCANGTGYLEDRYVPLGTPDADGVYPSTAGTKTATPSSLVSKYGDTFYSYNCGGTYKWYLQQYIDAAKSVGAIPVLVTPVSRLYYNSDGTIKPHHDSTDKTTGTYVSSNDAYVTAVKQLASEQNVLLLDGFAITKSLYEETYKNDSSAKSGVSQLATQIMAAGDKTHSNKLGGFITAALFASKLQDMNLSISKAVSMPAKTAGINPDGQQIFSINGSSVFTAMQQMIMVNIQHSLNIGLITDKNLLRQSEPRKMNLIRHQIRYRTLHQHRTLHQRRTQIQHRLHQQKLQYGLSEIQQFHLSVISIIILDMAGVHSFLHILMILLQ